MTDRYDISSNPEAQYQPGSDNQVLLNKRGITDLEEMEGIEFDELLRFEQVLFDELAADKRLTAKNLCDWHRDWLGGIYEWAGEYRSVNMSREDFVFAAAHLIPKLMADFERDYMSVLTPCCEMNKDELIEAMAVCHVEFIIIHPFREGNGRLGRVLSTVMALQADMPVLDFGILENDKDQYIQAIHAGHAGNYEPMKLLFSEILAFSIQQASLTENNE